VKFIDEVTITVQSGDGGAGCVSFRREKFIPRGGPDGGDGGKGGDVILRAASQKRTLYDFHFKRHFRAQNGRHGEGQKKSGKHGQDLVIDLPPGTVVADSETGTILKDLIHPGDAWLAARGGRGGQGNEHFKSATRQAPRFAQPGEAGELKSLRLELKLIADVGLVGLPNAGKSTLIRAISAAKPKTGAYPFTTLSPNLGVVKKGNAEPFVVADIPGLIAGAHQGAGLGTRFLRHIERTRILVHLVDITDIAVDAPLGAYRTVNDELAQYSRDLTQKPQIVVLNKMDVAGSTEKAAVFEKALAGKPVLRICALTGSGTDQLINRILQQLDRLHG
jgi:GTP-binding protein